MKEIKAFVRTSTVQKVVWALEEAGFRSMTVIDVSALGSLADSEKARLSIEFIERYSKLAKIELVCKDSDADRVVKIIQQNACTHQHGDGIIFVSPVERAVKIRTCDEGEQVLQD